jgi:ketosteroid isomerase-like protein
MQVHDCSVRQNQEHRTVRHRPRSLVAKIVSVTIVSLPLLSCARNEELPSEVIHAFELAFNKDDIAACMQLFTEDAQVLPEHGEVIADHAGIEKFLKDSMTWSISFNTLTDMTLVRGDLAIEQGQFKYRDIRRGSDIEWGKYLHVWRKVRGDWKLYRIIYNADEAPAVEVSVEPVTSEAGS